MNIGIIGLGLMGGSLGRALVKKTDNKVFGRDVSAMVQLKAEMLDAFHEPLNDDILNELDLVCISVYPRAFESVLNQILPHLRVGATVIDVGGVKARVVEAMERAHKQYPNIEFVATHPMAGREFSGVEHSTVGLYDNASVVLIPVHTDMEPLVAVKDMFLSVGASDIVVTDVKSHDKMIAYTSQLAHVVSSAYVKSPTAEKHDGFSAGSFRDLTRVAKLNPAMWTELMTDNSENLVEEINIFIDNLTQYRDALLLKDEERLFSLLAEGNEKKEGIERATRRYKTGR